MMRRLLPGETVWRTWTEVQEDALRYFALLPEKQRRLLLAAGARLVDAPLGFGDFLALIETGRPVVKADQPLASFRIASVPPGVLQRALCALGSGRVLYGLAELLFYGIRGHRNLCDADGREIPYRAALVVGLLMPDGPTATAYANGGFMWALGTAVCLHNLVGEYRG
jgi:hypothetical protein